MTAFLCGLTNTGANAQVLQNFNNLTQFTYQYESLAANYITQLGTFQLPNLSFVVQPPTISDYAIAAPGAIPALQKIPDLPTSLQVAPSGPAYNPVSPVPFSTFGDVAPVVPSPVFGTAPDVYKPAFQPSPNLVDLGSKPTFGDRTHGIQAPSLHGISIPDIPAVIWPDVSPPALPAFSATPPDARNYAFTLDPYTIQIISDVKPVIESMLAGTSGLPQSVEDALWNRAAQRESLLAFQSEQEAYSVYASRGFTLPGGPLNAMVMKTRQDALDKKSQLSRDVMIRVHEVLIDQLKFAVAQGIAYEDLFVRMYLGIQNLKMESAKFAVQIALDVFRAQVEVFRAECDLTRLQLEAKRDQIQMNVAILDGYKAQIDAQRLIGTLNQQLIDQYTALQNAVMTDAKIYQIEVEAYRTTIEENSQIIQQARLLIDEETAKLHASEVEAQIYATGVQAQATQQQSWGTRVQSFMTQVSAWAKEQDVFMENAKLTLGMNSELAREYEAKLAGFNASINAARAQMEAITRVNEEAIQGYSSFTSGTSAYNNALTEKMRSVVSLAQHNVELLIKNGETNIQNALEGKRMQEQALSTATQSVSQLLSSALSAHHTSASISDSSSASGSCSYSTSQVL